MAQPLTPQQIADAVAKRRQTQAANRAAGTSVRQQRAAKAAAKAGQPQTPPPAPKAPPRGNSWYRRRRRRHTFTPNPTPQVPVFTAPKQSYRPLRLIALAALEAAFVQKLEDAGGVSALTDIIRNAFARYKKVKALALGVTSSPESQTEADSALRLATIELVKLAY